MYTRCPHCDTVFRVTSQQLQASSGRVRCGRCETVFDAFSSLSSMPPAREAPATGSSTVPVPEQRAVVSGDAPAPAVPVTAGTRILGEAPAAVLIVPTAVSGAPAAVSGAPTALSVAPTALSVAPTALSVAPVAAPVAAKATPVLDVGRLAQEPLTLPDELFQPGLIPPTRRWLWLAVNLALLCALAGQAAWFFATPLAMQAPVLAPVLNAYCSWLGCGFGLPRLPEQLFIEASDLQLLDVTRPGQVLLTATIRNRAAFAQEFPMLELTLTGVDNQTAARRVFPPGEYLDPKADPARGIGAQEDVSIRLYLDTAELRATGYRLYLFFA